MPVGLAVMLTARCNQGDKDDSRWSPPAWVRWDGSQAAEGKSGGEHGGIEGGNLDMSHRDRAEDPLLEDAGQPHLTKGAERMGGDDSLAEARQRLEAHMDNSPLAVIEFDSQFRIVRWSGGAQRMFGWTATEVLGRPVSDMHWVHEDDSESVRRLIADMLSGTCSRNRHVNRNYRKDGGVVYCEWYNSVIYDDQGRLISIFF